MRPPVLRLTVRQLIVIGLVQALALFVQAWLSRELLERGIEPLQAHYLAYLAVPPVLLLMLGPVLFEQRQFLAQLYALRRLTVPIALAAVALGVTMRCAWWAQLIARISFGLTASDNPQPAVGPVVSFACPPLPALLLGVLVMAVLVPLIEETTHRGLLQLSLSGKGPARAIMLSALVFAAFHSPASYGFVFVLGIVLGVQFWVTGSLWTTVITHSTYNLLAQLDWRCLHGHWNPPPESVPLVGIGSIAVLVLLATLLTGMTLLRYLRAGARNAPAPAAT